MTLSNITFLNILVESTLPRMSRKTVQEILLKGEKPHILVSSYDSVLTLSVLSFLGRTEDTEHGIQPIF